MYLRQQIKSAQKFSSKQVKILFKNLYLLTIYYPEYTYMYYCIITVSDAYYNTIIESVIQDKEELNQVMIQTAKEE